MSDSASYRLNESQRQVWRDLVSKPPRGGQTRIAKALNKVIRQTEATWKNALAGFFNGDEAGLKKILQEPKLLEIVAKELDRTPEDLRDALRTATGGAAEDVPLTLRVPGFEDLGALPVLDAFFAPERGEVRWSMPAHERESVEHGGLLELDPFLEVIDEQRDDLPLAIVFVAEAGLGKSPTLRALAAKLDERECPVVWWPEEAMEPGSIVFQDDLDRLSPSQRAHLIAEVYRTNAALIATSSVLDPLADLPREHVIARLQPYHPAFGVRYLEHLERLWSSRGPTMELHALRSWLDDDPYTSALACRVDTLGTLARHVSDGGKVPVRHADVMRLSLERWERLLRQRGRGPTALTLRLCGAGALGRVLVDSARAGTGGCSDAELSRAFVAEATGLAGSNEVPWAGLGAPGMLTVIEELIDVGMLQRHGDTVQLAQASLVTAILGRELARHLDDPEIVRAIVLGPDQHDALLVAAEELGDPCPVLEAIDRQPAGVQCMAFPALTRLLSASPPPSSAEQLDQVFRRCLRWWIHCPASHTSFTMTLGVGYQPSQPRPEFQRIANLPPLVSMGLASKRHQGVLKPVDVDAVLKTPLGATVEGYLEITGMSEVSHEDARLALLVGAPYQATEVLDGALWRELPPLDHGRTSRMRRVLQEQDYGFWWRVVGAPRLEQEKDGQARIAGTAGGMSIASSMFTTLPGEPIWRDALQARIAAGDPGAPAAFAEAVAFTLAGGANDLGLISLWGAIPDEQRPAFRRAALAAIPEPASSWRYVASDWVTWILRDLADDERRRAWWRAWMAAPVHDGLRTPWRSFYEIGHPVEEIVEWALRTLPKVKDGPIYEVVPSQSEAPTGLMVQAHEPERASQREALRFFLHGDDVDALGAIVRSEGRPKLRQKAFERLSQVDGARARQVAFELARRLAGDQRLALLVQLSPALGEEETWQAFADTAHSLPERLVRLVQAECASEQAGDWARTRAVLGVLDVLVGPRPLDLARMDASLREALGSVVVEAVPSIEPLREEICAALLGILEGIAATLIHAHTLGQPALDLVVRVAFRAHLASRTDLRAAWVVVLAALVLGEDLVVTLLEQAHALRSDDAPTRQRLVALTRFPQLRTIVLRAAVHPRLRDAAAPVAATLTLPAQPAVAEGILRQLPLLDDSGEPAPCMVAWIRHWAAVDGAGVVRWLRRVLDGQAGLARRAWWRQLIAALAPGGARAEAIDEWAAYASIPAQHPKP